MTLVDVATGRSGPDVTEGEIYLELGERPLGLMVGYQGDAERTPRLG